MVTPNKRINGEAVSISHNLTCHAIDSQLIKRPIHVQRPYARHVLAVKMAACSKNVLSLKENYKKHSKESTRQLAGKFKCGRTQIQGVLKNKDSLVRSFKDKAPLSRKRIKNIQ